LIFLKYILSFYFPCKKLIKYITSAPFYTRMPYLKYYDLENYLFNEVNKRFHKQRYLEAFDFFCIIIWKANRAKTTMARRLKKYSKDLDKVCRDITEDVYRSNNKLKTLLEWGFRLPMASAILTVFYPDDFTVYDIRVCEVLSKYHKLGSSNNISTVLEGYSEFVKDVKKKVPSIENLRDKDRYMWAESFYKQLKRDIENGFEKD